MNCPALQRSVNNFLGDLVLLILRSHIPTSANTKCRKGPRLLTGGSSKLPDELSLVWCVQAVKLYSTTSDSHIF